MAELYVVVLQPHTSKSILSLPSYPLVIYLRASIELTLSAKSPPPIFNYPTIVSMKLTVQGFIILDYASRFAEGRAYLADLRSKGKIDYAYAITDGLENCVQALEEVFGGKNYGKA